MHTSRTCVTVDLFVLYCGSCSIATPQPRSANRTGQQGQSREYSKAFIVPQDGDRHSPGSAANESDARALQTEESQSMTRSIALNVNGQTARVMDDDPNMPLLYALP